MKHGTPPKEKDVGKLQRVYYNAGIHKAEAGRMGKKGTIAEDVSTAGANKGGASIERWKYLRTFERETAELWEDPGSDLDESEEADQNLGSEQLMSE